MRSAYFSKSNQKRLDRIMEFTGRVLLIHPKKTPRKIKGVVCITYEDLTKDKVWLVMNKTQLLKNDVDNIDLVLYNRFHQLDKHH